MSEENQTNQSDTKPILNTNPVGSDVICETFAQKDTSNTQTRNDSSSK